MNALSAKRMREEAIICEPIRTPVGRYGGVFKDLPAVELAEAVIRELINRTRIDPQSIDDVIFGQCYPNGEAPAIGRIAALNAGPGNARPGSSARSALRLGTPGRD